MRACGGREASLAAATSLTLTLALVICLAAGPAWAADSNWIASSGNWSDGNCWAGGEPNASRYAYITNGGTATISQMGEACANLYLGYTSGHSGTVNLIGGRLDSNTDYVGYSGTGTFTQTDGNNRVSGSLYMGYLSGSSGTYQLDANGCLTAGSEYIGRIGNGYFHQTGGVNSAGYVLIGAKGRYDLTGGTLQITTGLDSNGLLDFGGGSGVVSVGPNCLVNLGSGIVQNGGLASLTVGDHSLVILPVGFDPNVGFRSFSNAGMTHTKGTSLVIPAGQSLCFSGTLGDLVDCQGSLTVRSGGAITLNNALTVSAGGNVSLGSGDLSDTTARVGQSGSGVFTQTDGNHTVSGEMYVGQDPGSSGSYLLSGHGSLKVGDNEHVGYQGTGTFTQSDGNHTVTRYLYLGDRSGSSGSYLLSGSGRLAVTLYEYIGYEGTGSFTQSGGVNVCQLLNVGYRPGITTSLGSYVLNGPGCLTDGNVNVGNGSFTQTDGNHIVLGTLSIVGAGSHGRGTYALSGTGRLSVNGDENVSNSDFAQSGGDHTIRGSLTLGNVSSDGNYVLNGPGQLSVAGSEYGESYSSTTFTQSDGNHTVGGTLYLGYTGIYNSKYTYLLSGTGRLVATAVCVGKDSNGVFIQSGGTNTDANLTIGARGIYGMAAGTFGVTNLLVNAGLLDFSGGAWGTLQITGFLDNEGTINLGGRVAVVNGVGCICNMTAGTVKNAISGSFYLDANSILFLPAGLDPHYSNAGKTYTPDMTFVVEAGQNFSLAGPILCHVTTSGAVGGIASYLDLLGGLNVLSGGRVTNLRTLRVEDANSGLGAGTLLVTGSAYVGFSATGVFTQADGNHSDANLYLGYNPGSRGTYLLSARGRLTVTNAYVGYSGTGSFTQNDGNPSAVYLYLGYNSGSSGSYLLNGSGCLNCSLYEYVGKSGTGVFTQTDGNNSTQYLYLGSDPGSYGSYLLSGRGRLVASYEVVGVGGTGVFTQNDGNHTVSHGLYLGHDANSSGAYVLNGPGRLMVSGSEYLGYSGVGVFTQSDGNHSITGSLYMGSGAGASGSYLLNGPGRLIVSASEYLGDSGVGVFTQSDGNNTATGSLYVGYNSGSSGTYQLSGSGRLVAGSEYIAWPGTGLFQQSGGQNTAGYLSIGVKGRFTLTGGSLTINGGLDSNGVLDMSTGSGVLSLSGPIKMKNMGRFDLGGETLSHLNPNLNVSIYSDGNFHVLSSSHRLDSVLPWDPNILAGTTVVDAGASLILSKITQQALTVSGSLSAGQVVVGMGSSGKGTFSIADANAVITISNLLTVAAKGNFSAATGSTIHMTGSAFGNQSTDANLLAGMANLRLIYESADANYDPFEVAGLDLGADASGFLNNFGLGTLQLGGDGGPGRVILVDLFDNQPGSSAPEAFYVQSLIVNPGSELCLNGLHLYVGGALVKPGDGDLYGGGEIYANVPEPATLTLLAVFGLALARRRRRFCGSGILARHSRADGDGSRASTRMGPYGSRRGSVGTPDLQNS